MAPRRLRCAGSSACCIAQSKEPGDKTVVIDRTEELLNIKEAARLLSVSEVSLRRWTDSGRLPCIRVGARRERRFRRADLLSVSTSQPRNSGQPAASPSRPRETRVDLEGLAIDYSNHLCALYESDPGRRKMALPFLADGLRNGDFCVVVARPEVRADLYDRLCRGDSACERAVRENQLRLWDGFACAKDALDAFERAFLEALGEGFKAMRVVGDMAWFFDMGMTFEELERFEVAYNHKLAHSYPVVSLCLYDVRRFTGRDILGALRSHSDTFKYPLERFLGP